MNTYSKRSTAKTLATKMAKRHGVPYTTMAVDGGFQVIPVEAYEIKLAELEDLSAKRDQATKASRVAGGSLGSKIPCGAASTEEQIAAVYVYAELTGNVKIKNYMDGINPEYLSLILGKSKTRWGAIGNVRAAVSV